MSATGYIGMLWADFSSDTFIAKVDRAVKHHTKKYGTVPNLVYVNPKTLGTPDEPVPAGIEVRTSTAVQPNHFFLCVEKESNHV